VTIGGGPSKEQKNAAQSQANLTNELSQVANRQQDFFEKQQNSVNPFYQQRMKSGLPYYNLLTDAQSGLTAQAFAPARQQLLRQMGTSNGLPSGFRTQALSDFNANQARAFDQNLLGAVQAQEQAKQAGAAGLLGQAQIANPTGYFQGALGGNSSIMNAPLQRPGIGGILGGAAGGALGAVGF